MDEIQVHVYRSQCAQTKGRKTFKNKIVHGHAYVVKVRVTKKAGKKIMLFMRFWGLLKNASKQRTRSLAHFRESTLFQAVNYLSVLI